MGLTQNKWIQKLRHSIAVTTYRWIEREQAYPLDILYEDDDLCAIDKPPGVVVHPTRKIFKNSVVEMMRRRFPRVDWHLLHRLDRETSGVLVLAKSSEAAGRWGKELQRRSIVKTYVARVKSHPPLLEGEISAPIERDRESLVKVRRKVSVTGEEASTKYQVILHEKETSLLKLLPKTGRTHQLRVHCFSIGCPIVGDHIYGQPDQVYLDYVKGIKRFPRLELHAWKWEGKMDGTPISIESPLPKCLNTLDNKIYDLS